MPEELNRIVTDHLSTLLLCPTQTAVANLKREGITTHVYHVGDVMYDLASAVQPIAERSSTILEQLNLARRHYAVATVHRAETTDDESTLAEVVRYLQAVAADLPVIVPLHPRTRKALASARIALDGLRVIGPLGYLDMSQLARNSSLIITDSGGLQKEAYFYRVPCITLRKETEWTETIGCGWNRLWMEQDYKPRTEIVEYGDGTASETIAQAVVNTFG
jgi:UDP-GlcNAc3NAcA epimerase